MIRKIKNKLLRGREVAGLLEEVLRSVTAIRASGDLVALYGSPTGPHWLGIANATRGLYGGTAIEIPQSYSNPVFTTTQLRQLSEKIIALKFKRVVISGFAPYFFDMIDRLSGHCEIQTIYHGTISEFHSPVQQQLIKGLISYARTGKVQEVSFVKEGLAEVFIRLYGLHATHLPLQAPHIPPGVTPIAVDPLKTHIGVFGGDTFNKNLHNQVIYALMIPNTIVHVLDDKMFDYLDMNERIVGHGTHLPKEKFLSILGAMTVNLYMSYSESWGLVAYESEAMGVPAVRMDHVDYYEKILTAIESRKR
ncbi:MAG: glycosyltransferase [Bacteroidetes bacterium]|nr:glycosyltransferase [Bacteroidota bacterium]